MNLNKFKHQITRFIAHNRVIDNPMLCYAYGTDASLYRMVPKLVVFVDTEYEMIQLIKLANTLDIKITFRAAGTSLSGQAVTDNVLVILSDNSWKRHSILNNGLQIKLEPGIIASQANQYLKPYNRKIGPDPSSINSCKIGGVVANNASGMCCGIVHNTYRTMSALKVIFANGFILDSVDAVSREQFVKQNSDIINGILSLKTQISNDSTLIELIKYKFRIKNNTGYSLNAFLDYEDPIDILIHLFVGSEGTLGFISEIIYNSVPDIKLKQVSLIYLNSLSDIVKLSVELSRLSIEAMELMDTKSLQSIQHEPRAQAYLPKLTEDTVAILLEITASDLIELDEKLNSVKHIINNHNVYFQVPFTQDEEIITCLWTIREGILPSIGVSRVSGSTVIIEDIAVAIEQLPEVITELHRLFKKYNYHNVAIFGHILAGNIHFVFTPKLDDAMQVEEYKQFMQEMATMIGVYFKGSLKAEHGCGRNIAPFVELEWGKIAYNIMWQIKLLLDPNNIFNPDVILSHDSQLHLKNLKQMQSIAPLIDGCMECGFCESLCPSKSLTLTPRQRITTYRYLEKLRLENSSIYKEFKNEYQYYGIDTCATTGLCAIKCPVGIDTGKFILHLRHKEHTFVTKLISNKFSWFVKFNRLAVAIGNVVAKVIGANNLFKLSKQTHKIIPIMPVYIPNNAITSKNIRPQNGTLEQETILYLPSCSTRIISSTNERSITEQVIRKMGFDIERLFNSNSLCCGQVFTSKGYVTDAENKIHELYDFIQNSNPTKYTDIIMDNSSCYYTMSKSETNKNINITDIVSFFAKNIDKLSLRKRYNKIALHIDCSSIKIGNKAQILKILNKCTKQIVIPENITCCGFAGTKGFTNPELNESALSSLAKQIESCDIGVTFNRNCQIGLSFHGKVQYISLSELIYNCMI